MQNEWRESPGDVRRPCPSHLCLLGWTADLGELKSGVWGKEQRTEARPEVTVRWQAGIKWLNEIGIPSLGAEKPHVQMWSERVHRMKDSLMSEIHTPVEYNRKINSKWRWKSSSRLLLSTKKTNWLLQWFQLYVNGAFKELLYRVGEKVKQERLPARTCKTYIHTDKGKRETDSGLDILGFMLAVVCLNFIHMLDFQMAQVWSVFSHLSFPSSLPLLSTSLLWQ